MSQRIYLSSIGDSDSGVPIEVVRWQLAKEFGWSLEYIDALPVATLHEYWQIQDGIMHIQKSIIKR